MYWYMLIKHNHTNHATCQRVHNNNNKKNVLTLNLNLEIYKFTGSVCL